MLRKKNSWRLGKTNPKDYYKQIDYLLKKIGKTLFSQGFVPVSVLVALTVWTVWLILVGPSRGFSIMIANWEAAVTMVFGSMVAGGTSMGGGAVAFPVFTKVLHFPPHDAMVFSLAIQSIGMSAASLTIVAMKTKVEWRFIRWTSLGGIPGIIFGSALAPHVPSNLVKISFTMMVSSFVVILYFVNRIRKRQNVAIPCWGRREQVYSLITGVLGGIVSGLVGSGMDIVSFSVMVLLFGICEKVGTPTSVILMAINAVTGFIIHKFFIGDFVEPVVSYWIAAVPVVVVGAPLGAILSSLLSQENIVRILMTLIFIELVSSFLLIPLNATIIIFSIIEFVIFLSIYYWMYGVGQCRSILVQKFGK